LARILEQHERQKMTMGECLLVGQFPVEALPHLEADAAKHPEMWGHWNNLGICKKYLGDYAGSIQAFNRALALLPDSPHIHHNYAMACEEVGDFNGALAHYARAAANSQNPDAHYGFAQAALRDGKFDAALQVWEAARISKRSAIFIPNLEVWRGQDLGGKKVLVTREGGYGDTFWLMRYLKPLKDQGAHVTFHMFKSLAPLLTGHPWIDRVLTPDDEINEQEFDYQVPLWSIMWELYKKDKKCVPLGMGEPYIKSNTPKYFPTPSVGIVWKAGEMLAIHRKLRSIQDELLPELAKTPVNWFSLVPGEKPDWCVNGIAALADGWKTTADWIAGLDFVVSADTSTFHLAAAMGKPTLVFCPKNRDWKFFRSGETSPWYPSVKVISNPDPVSFKPVVDRIVEEVTRWAESRSIADLQLQEVCT